MINYTAKVQLFLHSYNRLFMAFHIPNIWHRHKKRTIPSGTVREQIIYKQCFSIPDSVV